MGVGQPFLRLFRSQWELSFIGCLWVGGTVPAVPNVVSFDLTNGHEVGTTVSLLREENTQIRRG